MSDRDDSWEIPWYLVLIFAVLAMGISITGYLYYQNQEAFIRKEKQQELAAIIDLKIGQIISWRQEHLDYASTIMDDPFLALRVRDFLRGRASRLLKNRIIDRLTALAFFHYQSVALIDPQGKVRLTVPNSKEKLTPYMQSLASEVMATKQVIFSDLYRDENSKVRISVLIPLLVIQRDEKVIVGVLLMRIEPYQFLYPLIKSWPTPSLTGETELVEREGNEVVFLNELRHRQNIPLNLRFPLNTPNLVAAMIFHGKKGIVEGLDYRGVPVLAAVGPIPDSPWFLVAKIDANEVYAPLKKRGREVVFFFFILIASAGISVAYFWRNQQSKFYRRQYEVERQRRALAQRYEYLTRYANDIILVTDQNLMIMEANDRALASYGYDRDEFLNLPLSALYPPESRQVLDGLLGKVEEQGGLIFETIHQRKDGSTFPAEVSLRLLEVEGDKLFQEIIRDITERKRTEEVLKESEKNLRRLASQLLRAQEDERKRLSGELHDELGHALLTLKLQLESVEEQLLPQQDSLKSEVKKILGSVSATIEEVRRLYHDLSPGDLEDLGLTTAIRSLVEDFAELQKHIKWKVNLDYLDGLFPLSTQTAIYRVMQEALTNIGKHANPKQVSLEISRAKRKVFFAIEDDGAGFDRNKVVSKKKTLGLLAMEERVKILGGSFELRSQPNRGTRISFTIPIPAGG